ncbi:multidrug effflux MFS transporter [Iodobacter sp. HSC-16F04]|uniref:Bcr/CflA family efflux transporter n=2 Tax=Iodobacter violaceini TaxID=3044271 RepID=A0ABX0KZC3_9NEIS|nr:multidrug effflux MFS transporter [Iodobacter violacea]
MARTFSLILATLLMMFPQIAETIYSPALSDISHHFAVSPELAAQTLSLYFLAFAVGVVVWGRMCDVYGRRPTMMAGLLIYAIASLIALCVNNFNAILLARMLAAFGAAVGSVVTQTMLRDLFKGLQLAQVFSLMGIALAISPAIGMYSGSLLSSHFGYQGVFTGLFVLALVLLIWAFLALPETKQAKEAAAAPLLATAKIMLKDLQIWQVAFLVASFNICLFAYYSLAPFMFEQLGLSTRLFGYTGLILAMGAGVGSILNKHLLKHGAHSHQLVLLASVLTILGGIGVSLLQHSSLFVLPMLLVVTGFGIAIPNILSSALHAYQDRTGTAGALLGLLYYLLIGSGLTLAGWSQSLGSVILICGSLATLISMQRSST